jgi:hypothetical protein
MWRESHRCNGKFVFDMIEKLLSDAVLVVSSMRERSVKLQDFLQRFCGTEQIHDDCTSCSDKKTRPKRGGNRKTDRQSPQWRSFDSQQEHDASLISFKSGKRGETRVQAEQSLGNLVLRYITTGKHGIR